MFLSFSCDVLVQVFAITGYPDPGNPGSLEFLGHSEFYTEDFSGISDLAQNKQSEITNTGYFV